VEVWNAFGTAASEPAELEVLQPGYLYWSTIATIGPTTSDSRIKRANLDGSAVQTVLSDPARGRFGGVAFDPAAGHLYTGDGQNVYRANFDGTDRQTIVSGTTVTDVELDLLHGHVYWAGYDRMQSTGPTWMDRRWRRSSR